MAHDPGEVGEQSLRQEEIAQVEWCGQSDSTVAANGKSHWWTDLISNYQLESPRMPFDHPSDVLFIFLSNDPQAQDINSARFGLP
jgi:hypothetical protein